MISQKPNHVNNEIDTGVNDGNRARSNRVTACYATITPRPPQCLLYLIQSMISSVQVDGEFFHWHDVSLMIQSTELD